MNTYTAATNLSSTVLMWVFALVCVGVAFVSILLWYHWIRYGMKDPKISFAQIVYFLGLFILVFITLTLLL